MITGCKLNKDDNSSKLYHTMYKSMIGILLYVTGTRLDVMQAVGLVARFQSSPKETHVTTVKITFKYLKGTMEHGLWYPKSQDVILKAFTNADWAGSVDDRKAPVEQHSSWEIVWYLGQAKTNLLSHYPQPKPNTLLLRHVALKSFG